MSVTPAPAPAEQQQEAPPAPAPVVLTDTQRQSIAASLRAQADTIDPPVNGKTNSLMSKVPGASLFGLGGGRRSRRSRRGKRSRKLRSRRR